MTDIVERLRICATGPGDTHTVVICRLTRDTARDAADEITRLRASLEKIAAMRPPIPEDAEGNGPNWEQYIYTKVWALFAASLQDTARAALGGER